jgi:hypothetical protein
MTSIVYLPAWVNQRRSWYRFTLHCLLRYRIVLGIVRCHSCILNKTKQQTQINEDATTWRAFVGLVFSHLWLSNSCKTQPLGHNIWCVLRSLYLRAPPTFTPSTVSIEEQVEEYSVFYCRYHVCVFRTLASLYRWAYPHSSIWSAPELLWSSKSRIIVTSPQSLFDQSCVPYHGIIKYIFGFSFYDDCPKLEITKFPFVNASSRARELWCTTVSFLCAEQNKKKLYLNTWRYYFPLCEVGLIGWGVTFFELIVVTFRHPFRVGSPAPYLLQQDINLIHATYLIL